MVKLKYLLLMLIANNLVSIGQTQLGQNIEASETYFAMASSVSSSVDGNRVAVGGYGKSDYGFKVYNFDGANWIQVGNDLNTQYPNEISVYTVSLSADGNRIAVGAVINQYPNDSGYVKIYDFDGSNWIQIGSTLQGESNSDFFGSRISFSANGSRLIVGSKFNNNSYGNARVFQFNGSDWIQIGDDLDPDDGPYYFGTSVSISPDGQRIAVGANQFINPITNAGGLVKAYEFVGDNWVQIGEDLYGENSGDNFGISHSFSGNGSRIAIGASEIISREGYVKIFDFSGSDWNQVGLTLNGEAQGDYFGRKVTLSSDGTRLAIGSPSNTQNGNRPGLVRLFQFQNSNWFHLGEDIEGDFELDRFGRTVSLSSDGNTIIIGALDYVYQQSGTESGYAKVYDLSELVLSINDFSTSKYIIYPNPAKETIQIVDYNKIKDLMIFDSLGRLVLRSSDILKTIDISTLQRGVYYVNLLDLNNKRLTIKMIKD